MGHYDNVMGCSQCGSPHTCACEAEPRGEESASSVDDGWETRSAATRSQQALRGKLEAETAERYAPALKNAGVLLRWLLKRRIKAEVARELERSVP